MSKLNRVFFHELGHFVAHELNQIHYSGHGISEMAIHPCEQNFNELCGYTRLNKPFGYDDAAVKAPPLYRLPQKLASLAYGCIFQAYLTGSQLSDCYQGNGRDDMNSWAGYIGENKFGYRVKAEFAKFEAQYFATLIANNSLDEFKTLIPNDYLSSVSPDHYKVDVEILRKATRIMLKGHYQDYHRLIKGYKKIVKENTKYYWLTLIKQRLGALQKLLTFGD